MPTDFGVVLHPWNLEDSPPDLLERLVGEVGLTHVILPVVTGPLTQFRFNRLQSAPYFHTEGGWQFPVDVRRLMFGGLRPRLAEWFGRRDVLSRVCDRAARLGVALRLRADPLANAALRVTEESLRPDNAWGQLRAGDAPCLSHPQTREYLRAALQVLREFVLQGLELEAPAPLGRGWGASSVGVNSEALADVCFCSSCREIARRAGVDPDPAARSIRVQIQQRFAHDDRQAFAADVQPDTVLEGYLRAVDADNHALFGELAETLAGGDLCLLRPGCAGQQGDPPPTGWSWLVSLTTAELARFTEAPRVALPLPTGAVCAPAWGPTLQASELVRFVSAAQQAAIPLLEFERIDEAPECAITWLKQAVRYARRESQPARSL